MIMIDDDDDAVNATQRLQSWAQTTSIWRRHGVIVSRKITFLAVLA